MASISIPLPGGTTDTVDLPPNIPSVPPALLQEIEAQISAAEPQLTKDFNAALSSGNFAPFNQDVQKLVGEILNDVETAYVCFCSGTLIRTTSGDVPVETLAIGDHVVTKSGATRPVVWLGQRTLSRETMLMEDMPVRVSAGALGNGLPLNELFLSPGHSICIDMMGEVLVPICHLINGSTISQVSMPEVTYWHVELESHDIIFSNGLPSESYIECGNRGFFVGENDRPDHVASLQDFCRPVLNDPVLFTALRSRIRSRALDQGWSIQHVRPEIWMNLNGVASRPGLSEDDGISVAKWTVPRDAGKLTFHCSTFRPYHYTDCVDLRDLGLRVCHVTIGGETVPLEMLDADGWYPIEKADDRSWRWTGASFALPDDWTGNACNGTAGQLEIAFSFANQTNARWVNPARRRPKSDLRLVAA